MKRLLAVTVGLLALGGQVHADPLGSLAQTALQGRLRQVPPREVDCDALLRSHELRVRLRPSERRERIARCRLEAGVVRIAGIAHPAEAPPDTNP